MVDGDQTDGEEREKGAGRRAKTERSSPQPIVELGRRRGGRFRQKLAGGDAEENEDAGVNPAGPGPIPWPEREKRMRRSWRWSSIYLALTRTTTACSATAAMGCTASGEREGETGRAGGKGAGSVQGVVASVFTRARDEEGPAAAWATSSTAAWRQEAMAPQWKGKETFPENPLVPVFLHYKKV